MTKERPLSAEWKEEDLRIIRELRLMDDDFMKIVFKDNIPATQYLIKKILPQLTLNIVSVSTEDAVSIPERRGVRFDILALDENGSPFNIEIQRQDKGAGQKRARLNHSMLDVRLLDKGDSTEDLPPTYVIFITEKDFFREGLPLYTIERRILELERPFGDESHILYVNGAYEGDDDIGRLMRDFRARTVAEMEDSPLKEVVRKFKETTEGVGKMCEALEKMKNEAEAEGKERGKIEILRDLVNDGMLELSAAAQKLGVSEDAFKKMAML